MRCTWNSGQVNKELSECTLIIRKHWLFINDSFFSWNYSKICFVSCIRFFSPIFIETKSLLEDNQIHGKRHVQISQSVIQINVVVSTVCGIYQLLGVHVVQNPLSILTVMSTLHDSKETFRGIVLQYNINNAVSFIHVIWRKFAKIWNTTIYTHCYNNIILTISYDWTFTFINYKITW